MSSSRRETETGTDLHSGSPRPSHSRRFSPAVNQARRALDLVQARNTPIHRLPVEILSRVFLLGYTETIDLARPFKRRPLEADTNFEVLVSHVCSHWRRVAFTVHALWTNIRLRKPAHLHRATEFVKRSLNAPLDILVDSVAAKEHVPGRTIGIEEFDKAFLIAMDQSTRWRSLIVKVCDVPCKERARANLRDCKPIPNLEFLQLWHVQDWERAQDMFVATAKPPIPILSDYVPNLLYLSLVGVNLAWSVTSYIAGLKYLELALHSEGCRPSPREFENMLRQCPDLERLRLHYSGPRLLEPLPEDIVHLNNLTELAFTDMDVDVLCYVMRIVKMPNVKLLELELPEQDFTPFLERLGQEQEPSFPRLERLRVVALECDEKAWNNWLPTIPALTYLEVDFRRVSLNLFDALVTPIPIPTAPVSVEDSTASVEAAPARLDGEPASSASSSTVTVVAIPPAGVTSTSSPHTPISAIAVSSNLPAPPPNNTNHSAGKDKTPDKVKPVFYPVRLPHLDSFKVAGLPSTSLSRFVEFRKKAGFKVPRLIVHIKSMDEETDKLQDEIPLEYYGVSDPEDEDECDDDEDEEDDDEMVEYENDEEEPEESGVTAQTVAPDLQGAGIGAPTTAVDIQDEVEVEYSDDGIGDEEEGDIDDVVGYETVTSEFATMV
ncbi:hypothetical protein OF83DRAFT_1167929 [Amylostereum chailletii]|nr:hypothetical protein OF83DRAFT_1167929 [Amylostereum chailletii]